MHETTKAEQAVNYYVAVGPGRTMEKLAQAYQRRTENPPAQPAQECITV